MKKFEIVSIPTKDVRIICPIHGEVKVQKAWDDILQAMTAISCAKCPQITKPVS